VQRLKERESEAGLHCQALLIITCWHVWEPGWNGQATKTDSRKHSSCKSE
jgi:hypothetical protein